MSVKSKKSFKQYNWWILVMPDSKLGSTVTLQTAFNSASSMVFLTSKLLPGDIPDTKKSTFQKFEAPGYNSSAINHVRNDNTTITVSVPVVNRRKILGNQLEMNGFERLRNQQINGIGTGLVDDNPYSKNPVAIYSGWGTHRPPLPVYIIDANFKHRHDFVNPYGFVEFTDVTLTMEYIEDSILFQAYKKWRNISSLISAPVQALEKWEF